MQVPFLDLKRVNESFGIELEEAFKRVHQSGWFIQGKELELFESEFADYSEVSHCVGVGNGLEAIHLLLKAYGIGPGDEVIVPSNTFIATWLAVTECGAIPVPAEPDPKTHNISIAAIEAALTPKTVAIIPVHLYGQPADMDPILALADKYGLVVIEDAAQAQGAKYKGRRIGGLGHAGATSFYPGKNLGALGDGGAVLTNDSEIAAKVRKLRNYGSKVKYQHDVLGYNSRLDELQAAFLRVKLRRLDDDNQVRKNIANHYSYCLSNSDLILPDVPDWADPVWHLYVIRTKNRDNLQQYLRSHGVETLVHYPIPPHRQECYATMKFKPLPIAEQFAEQVLSLPISSVICDTDLNYVVSLLKDFRA